MEIVIYLLLAISNLPLALDKENKYRSLNWISFGFCLALMVAQIIYQLIKIKQ